MTPPTRSDDCSDWLVADGLDTLTDTCRKFGCVGGVMTPPYKEETGQRGNAERGNFPLSVIFMTIFG